ncbi:MAG: bifunctional DNA primase/polymerase [Methanotrichaceae archaeon]|jgi:hypothetical protein
MQKNQSISLPNFLKDPKHRFIKLGSFGEWLKVPIEMGWNIFDLDELEAHIRSRQTRWDAEEASGVLSKLRTNGKHVPKRPEFRERLNNYSCEDPEFKEWLSQGKNYGVTSGGGLIKLESDDIARWEELGVLDLLPETATVQSSKPNRQHFYYYGPEVADSPLNDPETGKDIGHIRGTGEEGGRGGMVVGPGSMHPSGVRYTVIKDISIATITQEGLDAVKSILSKPKTAKGRLDATVGKLEEMGRIARESKGRAVASDGFVDPFKDLTCSQILGPTWDYHYEGDQMAGPNPFGNHSNQTGHNLVVSSDDKEFFCFACQQGGGVSRLIALKAGIMKCSDIGAPKGEEWRKTLQYAMDEGLIDKISLEQSDMDLGEAILLVEDLKEKVKSDPGCPLSLDISKLWQ